MPWRFTNGLQLYEKSSTSLNVRIIQIKATMRYHLTLLRMAITKTKQNKKGGKNADKR